MPHPSRVSEAVVTPLYCHKNVETMPYECRYSALRVAPQFCKNAATVPRSLKSAISSCSNNETKIFVECRVLHETACPQIPKVTQNPSE